MELKKTCLIKDKILMIAFSEMYSGSITHNDGLDYDIKYSYKIFVFDMVPDRTDVSGNVLTGLNALYPDFETLDYFYKNELNEQEFEKMFTLDWDFLKKTWEAE